MAAIAGAGGGEDESAFDRRLCELQFISSAFPEAEIAEDASGFSLALTVDSDDDSIKPPLHIKIILTVRLPPDYPKSSTATPSLQVVSFDPGAGSVASEVRSISASLADVAGATPGEECLFQIIQSTQENVRLALSQVLHVERNGTNSKSLRDDNDAAPDQLQNRGTNGTLNVGGSSRSGSGKLSGSCSAHEESLHGTVVIGFDHLKAKTARKTIIDDANRLGLVGCSRPGKPGLVVVQGLLARVKEYAASLRRDMSVCTRTGGCWGPDNHHFQSVSVLAEQELKWEESAVVRSGEETGFAELLQSTLERGLFTGMFELETETLMHLAHVYIAVGLKEMFYDVTGLDRNWKVPSTIGGSDPYLVPRGGTKMKCSNKRIHKK